MDPLRMNATRQWIMTGHMLGLLLGLVLLPVAAAEEVANPYQTASSTARHDKLQELNGPFASGQEVTRACLHCHTEAAAQVQKTTHWTWQYTPKGGGRTYGKQNVTNAFCGFAASNWNVCTRCHVGYGWKDPEVKEPSPEQVDCLVCHEQTGQYHKYSYGYAVLMSKGQPVIKPDLVAMAQSVGRPTRHNCGFCHFHGGASDGAKHGDLDSSLIAPSHELDVHMARNGLNFSCSVCHTAREHHIAGSRYAMEARDTRGFKWPGRTGGALVSCESCHGTAPHRTRARLNDHVDRVACQTCHIPLYARGGNKTKSSWDWSTAGRLAADDKIPPEPSEEAATDPLTHSRHHGTISWGQNLVPRYFWFDGKVAYTLVGDKIDDSAPVRINRISGRYGDGKSRIWPFKLMKARLPYDPVNKNMVINHAVASGVGDKEAFYRTFDWSLAVAAGMRTPGAPPYSGQVGFVDATMFFPLTHMVAPKESALQCRDCHGRDSRLRDLTDFYLLGRDAFPWIRAAGGGLALFTLFGVSLHGLLRLVLFWIRRRR
ncbi:MAG: tetrathionate reductase family octaheme c-type cytochrome [Magnetococcales bacterium]|nr:tetrathionate reductase family octaheme c-type cytochrome [Magnetococcales bacterium]